MAAVFFFGAKWRSISTWNTQRLVAENRQVPALPAITQAQQARP